LLTDSIGSSWLTRKTCMAMAVQAVMVPTALHHSGVRGQIPGFDMLPTPQYMIPK
jgi:hypothetical protein